jgi:hypothetical protein
MEPVQKNNPIFQNERWGFGFLGCCEKDVLSARQRMIQGGGKWD